MRRVIRDMEPDIIHVHTAQALLLLLFAGVRRPVVYTHHNIRCNFPLWLFRSEEHTSELQSLMRISYAVFCLKKKKLTNRLIVIQQPIITPFVHTIQSVYNIITSRTPDATSKAI